MAIFKKNLMSNVKILRMTSNFDVINASHHYVPALSGSADEDVLRLDIPVEYFPLMDILHCPADLDEELQNESL